MKINGKSWNFRISLCFLGNLGSMKSTPQSCVQAYFSRLRTEINNGRLAMLGIMAFLAESKVPGSVPALGGLGIAPYSGEVPSRRLLQGTSAFLTTS